MGRSRGPILFLACGLIAGGCGPGEEPERRVLSPTLLATATQDGPVAFRDPLGEISPDGRWLAFTEHRRVRVQPLQGGVARTYGTGERQPRDFAWLPDSRAFIVEERTYDRSRSEWFRYDLNTGVRTRYLEDFEVQAQPLPADTLARFLDMHGLTNHRPGPAMSQGLAVERAAPQRLWFWRRDSLYNGADMGELEGRVLAATRVPEGSVSCLVEQESGPPLLRLNCFGPNRTGLDQIDNVYGDFAWAPDGSEVYFARPDARGVLQLWAQAPRGGEPSLLAAFGRDAYAPSVDERGRVVFKTQDYRTFIATVPANGGEPTPLTVFQSETPTWSPDGSEIAVTFGDWRRAVDDAKYPDIAQSLGIVSSSPERVQESPKRVFRSSHSEDQGLAWSPNGRWVVFHTHADGTDDVFLQAADGSSTPVQISESGSETGWPRWSRDGNWIVFPSYHREGDGARRSALYVVGVDQEAGVVTRPAVRVSLGDFAGDALQAEWLDEGGELVFEGADRFGEKHLYRVPREGGTPNHVHTFSTDQVHSGIAASPDGRWVVFVAPDASGYYQLFRVNSAGGVPQQITSDATHKTQPSYDPTGQMLAFTVYDYQVQFWLIEP